MRMWAASRRHHPLVELASLPASGQGPSRYAPADALVPSQHAFDGRAFEYSFLFDVCVCVPRPPRERASVPMTCETQEGRGCKWYCDIRREAVDPGGGAEVLLASGLEFRSARGIGQAAAAGSLLGPEIGGPIYSRRRGRAVARLQRSTGLWSLVHARLVASWGDRVIRRPERHWVRRLLAVSGWPPVVPSTAAASSAGVCDGE